MDSCGYDVGRRPIWLGRCTATAVCRFSADDCGLVDHVGGGFGEVEPRDATLDWKSLEPNGRKNLTTQIVVLSKEYLSILGINAGLAALLVALLVVGKPAVAVWPDFVNRAVSGFVGAVAALAVIRMGYVVWRDYDIVKLQKTLIDASGDKEFLDKQSDAAAEKIDAMKSAGLRKVDPPTVTDWH